VIKFFVFMTGGILLFSKFVRQSQRRSEIILFVFLVIAEDMVSNYQIINKNNSDEN